MKRIFSKRSGFTLVEIIVAFAIFAIMAAMIVSMTGLAVRQRQSNNDLSKNLSEQQAYLAAHEKGEYDDSADKGEFEFNFKDSAPVSLGYSIAKSTDDESSDGGINYFIANANPKNNVTVDKDTSGDDAEEGAGLALTDQLDSRIYGSKDFEYIRISNVKPIVDDEITAAGNTAYTFESYAVDNDNAIRNKDSRIARNYKLSFFTDPDPDKALPAKVIDCGYYHKATGVRVSYKDASFGSDGTETHTSDNHFEIVPCSDNTVRVSVPQSVVQNNFAEANADKLDQYCFPLNRSYFYVVLEGNVKLDETSFGSNYYIMDYGPDDKEYLYAPVSANVKTDDEHSEVVTFKNVYGAFSKAGSEVMEGEEIDE